MEPEDTRLPNGPHDDVTQICTMILALSDRRADLDSRLTALPAEEPQRDDLWEQLDVVLAELSAAVARLAGAQSSGPDDVRAKANILTRLLEPAADDPAALSPEVVALALTVAREVSVLL